MSSTNHWNLNQHIDSNEFYILDNYHYSMSVEVLKNGKYNIPFGWYKNIKVLNYNDDLFNLLDNTDIICGDGNSGLGNVKEK